MTRTVTVAHVVLSLDPGGTEQLVLELARRTPPPHKLRVYCLDRAGEWSPQLTRIGIPVEVIGRRPGVDLSVAWHLRRLLWRDDVDVIHCHQYTPFVYGAMAAAISPRVRLVFTEHGRLSDAPPSPRRAVANKLLGPAAAVVTAVSRELRDFMVSEGFAPERVQVIHNGIDPGPVPVPSARGAARQALNLRPETFVVGTAARLDPVKNLVLAVDALARLRSFLPDATLVIVGEGPDRAVIGARIEQCGLPPGAVRWMGYRPDVRLLLPGFDAYINTSVSEGISVTILESMAAGLPVVATAVGGTPEIVVPGATGFLVPAGDSAGAVAALLEIANNPLLGATLGCAGRQRVQSHFDVSRMVNQYVTTYGSM